MSNQVILWLMFIVPWLTLFFMNREDIKRYVPVGLLTALTSVIFTETGITTGLWVVRETTFPLAAIPTYIYGALPVGAMWILKFTYGQFWLFLSVDAAFNFGFTFFIMPWLASRGILDFSASLITFIITIAHAIMLYSFQIWQEDIFVRPDTSADLSTKLQPAVAKPLYNDKKDMDDE